MNIFKNFLLMLRNYKIASVLNIIGLSIAFASFMIIMLQVKYDLTFDRHYENTDRIFRFELNTGGNRYFTAMTRPMAAEYLVSPDIEYKGLLSSFSDISLYEADKGPESKIEDIVDYIAEPGTLKVLEFDCIYGSPDRFAEPNTILLSQTTAEALFGKTDPVGRSLITNWHANPCEIIGVYKDFPKNSCIQTKSAVRNIGDMDLNNRINQNYTYYIRLNSAGNAERAHQMITEAWIKANENDTDFDAKNADRDTRLNPIANVHLAGDTIQDPTEQGNKPTVYALLTVAILIILIAIINFINFATSLVPIRIRSINTQKVLGGSNGAIRRNLITESVGIAVVALIVSLLIVEIFAGTSLASTISVKCNIGSDMQVLWGTVAVAVITGLIAGIYPAFYSTSFQPALVLKGSFGLSPKGRKLRTALIAFQYVISIALIITALSVQVQTRFMQNYDMGFQYENILVTNLSGPIMKQKEAFVSKLKSNPAIADVTFSQGYLVRDTRMSWGGMQYRGKRIGGFTCEPVAWNFPEVMGIKIVSGRSFTEADAQRDLPSYIFNETAQHQDSLEAGGRTNGWMGDGEIVGIAKDFNFKPLQFGIESIALLLSKEYGLSTTYIKINTQNIPTVIDYIKKTMKEFDPGTDPEVGFFEQRLHMQYMKELNLNRLITTFSLLSILISVIGVFGLILFETQYRRKEIGVRKVFGATIREILLMFNKGFIRIVLVCFVIATPIAYYIVKRWLENFTYKSPIPVWVFAVALAAVLLITIVTITLQSYKTATENPVKAIRTE